jgi:hypothetical protein
MVSMQKNFGISRRSAETSEPVNWRRGLFRLWLLISAAWIMGWAIYRGLQGIQGELATTDDLLELLLLLFAPPIALLLFGVAARWSIRGFAVDNRGPKGD